MSEQSEEVLVSIELVEEKCTECEEVTPCVQLEKEQLELAFQHSVTGVPIANISTLRRQTPNVFTGSDAVTWLQGRLIISRKDACAIATELLNNGGFSAVKPVKKNSTFIDGNQFYRLAKHDISGRFQPSSVSSSETFYLSVQGFQGCPFCKRAIEIVIALANEVKPEVLIVEAIEHENRVLYTRWLDEKKNGLSKNYPKVVYHTSSPIVYTTNTLQYIGGLDEMLDFLNDLPQFKNTATLKKYKTESPVATFVKGIPTIARNFKSTLPF